MPIHHAAQNASEDSHNENALTELAAERSLHPISSFAARGAGAGGGTAACRPAMMIRGAYSAASKVTAQPSVLDVVPFRWWYSASLTASKTLAATTP